MKPKSSSPLVSIIVTTRNNERTIEKCLQSIKNQTYKNIELIVVDNNSTDKTPQIAKEYADNFFTKGPERSAQRNYGVKKSRGEYVLIIDSDMYLAEKVIEACVAKALQGAKSVIIPEKSIGVGFWAKVKAFERSFYVGNDLVEAPRFFEKKLFLDLGGFDENITGFEDWDLANRTRAKGVKIERVNEFILHDEGKIDFRGSTKKKSYYAKWWHVYQAKYPEISKKQTNPLLRFPPNKLLLQAILHPILFCGFLILKFTEFKNIQTQILNKEQTNDAKL